jgi:hypothetical protein
MDVLLVKMVEEMKGKENRSYETFSLDTCTAVQDAFAFPTFEILILIQVRITV